MGFRLFCSAVIVSCSALIGLELRRRLFVRVRSLKYFRDYLRSVRSYISYVGMSLDDIASELNSEEVNSEFCSILREKTSYQNFISAFTDTLVITKKSLCITDEDFSLLCSVVNKIGASDIDGAIDSLNIADEQMSALIVSAGKKCETDGKLCVVLPLSCGAVAALLLM